MKNARSTEVKPSALDACLSILIVLANSPAIQQTASLLAVMMFIVSEVAL